MSATDLVQAFGWIPVCWLLTVHVLIRFGRLSRHGLAVRVAGVVAALTVVVAAVTAGLWPVAVLGLLFGRTDLLGHRHHDEREAHRVRDLLERFGRHHDTQPSQDPPARPDTGETPPQGAVPDTGDPGATPAAEPATTIPAARRASAQQRPPMHPRDELLPDIRIHHGPLGSSGAPAGASRSTATAPVVRSHAKDDPDFVPAVVGLRQAHHQQPQDQARPRGNRLIDGTKRFTDLLLKLEIVVVVVVALVLFGVWAEGQRQEFVRNTRDLVCDLSYSC